MRSQTFVDRWLSGEVITTSMQMLDEALGELHEEAETIRRLVQAAKYWDAYTRLATCILFFNMAAQQEPSKLPEIIQRLLDWIKEIKRELDRIVGEIGADGYSIGVSAPFGVSISISYTT